MRVSRGSFAILTLLLHAAIVLAQYSCPPTCTGKCRCASSQIPGGLQPEETPQFIVYSNDDAINVSILPVVLNITERHTNRNGCKMVATWFVSQQYTDPAFVQQVYAKGHEIATHTLNHVLNPSPEEIIGCKKWLNETAKIPLEDIQGYRSPFLAFSPDQRKVLYENGFRYDSSITESFPSTTSPDRNNPLWPYTLDYGIAQNCAISTGTCDASERYPEFWEFPMWNIQDNSGTVIASMDPVGDLYEFYKTQFDNRYYGNRGPMAIFLHAARLIADPAGSDQVNRFLEYAATKENVWFVPITEVLDWIENPQPVSSYQYQCPRQSNIGAAPCVAPPGGCSYGTFNANSCLCDCQNEMVNAAGYCKDATGSCTVQKSFDFEVTRQYVCPPASPAAPTPGSPTTTTPSITTDTPGCNGHNTLNYAGMTISGSGDASSLYAEGIKAIDDTCDTYAKALPAGTNSFFTVSLPSPQSLSAVKIQSTMDVYVDIYVGEDSSNNGLNNAKCATGAHIIPDQPNDIPCVGMGKVITITAPGPLTLADVFPIINTPAPATPSAPPTVQPSQGPSTGNLKVQFVVMGASTADFDAKYDKPMCEAIVKHIGDPTATCDVMAAIAVTNGGRRLFQENPAAARGEIKVTLQIVTVKPAEAQAALSNGNTLISILSPLGITVIPDSVSSVWLDPPKTVPAAAPAPVSEVASSSSSSVSLGVIIGGVVGGIAVVALIVGAVFYVRRRKASAASEESSGFIISNNSMYTSKGVTASISLKNGAHSEKAGLESWGGSPLKARVGGNNV